MFDFLKTYEQACPFLVSTESNALRFMRADNYDAKVSVTGLWSTRSLDCTYTGCRLDRSIVQIKTLCPSAALQMVYLD
jgi:hypothetical protein